jgi:PAS domain S-box-containing protein
MEQPNPCKHLEGIATILDSVADGVFTVDADMRIMSFNRAATEITGFSVDEALGRKCFEIFRTSICTTFCPLREALESGEPVVNRELDMLDRENRKVPISVSASVLRNKEGKAIGGVETFRDLSLIYILKREIKEKYSFRDLVSRNPLMRRLFDVLPDIASSDATVLLRGESGTGKELFTKAIHDLSPRNKGPLVIVNCGALPEPLLEAEIFGAKRGAYTGAVENRPGRLELADGGTLFLDEIGDLPLPLQVKLLRVLENREYQPLGARHPQKANVRFVAATHRDLAAMVDEGSFRRDLYFRINVVALQIPPLRDRREDIPLLIDIALDRFNQLYGKKIRGFSAEVLKFLLAYDYLGNVRELLNLVEQTVILCRGGEIGVEHMPDGFFKTAKKKQILPPKAQKAPTKENLAELLTLHKGNKTRVAQEYGVDRTTLWRWMKRMGLEE